jgi:hypothetical protein
MKQLIALLPVLVSLQVGVPPALAWAWPADGPVLRPFTLGDDPYAGGQHRGIDIGAPAGAPVRAPAAGTVSFSGSVPGGGRTLTIATADGYSATLVHLGVVLVSSGAAVSEGDVVGSIGPSGTAELAEPYVHFGIRRASDPNGYLDPLTVLPPAAAPPADSPQVDVPAPATSAGAVAPHPQAVAAAHPAAPGATRSHPRAPRVKARSPRSVVEARRRGGREPRGSSIRPAEPVVSAPARTELRFFEPIAAGGLRARASRPRGEVRHARLTVLTPLAAALLAALAALAVLRKRPGELPDAGATDRLSPVLEQRALAAAEDAPVLRLGEQDRVVLDRDLERILLAEGESLADLDRDHDPAELVDMANDPRLRRSSHGATRRRRAHRAVRPRLVLEVPCIRSLRAGSPRALLSNHGRRSRAAGGCSV